MVMVDIPCNAYYKGVACCPAWVRELIDEMDGVRKVGCYWVNRLSGMGIRSPFAFDHVNRILRFKGFSDPIHESEIFNTPHLIPIGILSVLMRV